MTGSATHGCPLCGHRFEGRDGCGSGCPFADGCDMIRCPNCRYEWVERSRLVELARRLLRRPAPKDDETGAPKGGR